MQKSFFEHVVVRSGSIYIIPNETWSADLLVHFPQIHFSSQNASLSRYLSVCLSACLSRALGSLENASAVETSISADTTLKTRNWESNFEAKGIGLKRSNHASLVRGRHVFEHRCFANSSTERHFSIKKWHTDSLQLFCCTIAKKLRIVVSISR